MYGVLRAVQFFKIMFLLFSTLPNIHMHAAIDSYTCSERIFMENYIYRKEYLLKKNIYRKGYL